MAIVAEQVPNKIRVECFICEEVKVLHKKVDSVIYMHDIHDGKIDHVCTNCHNCL